MFFVWYQVRKGLSLGKGEGGGGGGWKRRSSENDGNDASSYR